MMAYPGSRGENVDVLVDLLWHLDPVMRSNSRANLTPDALVAYLSDSDPHFTRYAVRQQLRTKIENAVLPEIASRLESGDVVSEDLVAAELMRRPEFLRVRAELVEQMVNSCRSLTSALDSLPTTSDVRFKSFNIHESEIWLRTNFIHKEEPN
jgi:hypothetical protein